MSFPANVRRAIIDRVPPARRTMKRGPVSVAIVVRLSVEPSRIKNIGGTVRQERQLNLTQREISCLQPFRTTLFGDRDRHRKVRLIINRRRAYLLSVTETGIVVFSYSKIW